MGELAKQLSLVTKEDNINSKDIKTELNRTHTDELVIALCGPIGTDIHLTAKVLNHILTNKYHYECIEIRLSDLIKKHTPDTLVFNEEVEGHSVEYKRLLALIKKGNHLRKEHGLSILAELAINEIAVQRETRKKEKGYLSERVCYIIDSIKNIEELELLRLIYRDIFYCIGTFASIDSRVSNLTNREMKTHEIYELIDRDSGEEMQFGQKVTDTFVEADFFLRLDDGSSKLIETKLSRFLHLIFSSEVITPTTDETAMYLAFAAAGNSACLSRQVGASITDENGEIISVGWNDVPKSGGSVYKSDTDNIVHDKRCINYENGICYNDREKSKIAKTLVDSLIREGIINEEKRLDAENSLKKSRIKELIEFSRAVHAEMLAIILAGQRGGNRLINATLYCTTYPCHNCARHIVAAGIKNVYYIEPYRKSMATKLHGDSITEDESKKELVRILMYDGTAPRRFLDFFKMTPSTRKSNGKKIHINFSKKSPKNTLSLQAIPYLEGMVTNDLKSKNLIHV